MTMDTIGDILLPNVQQEETESCLGESANNVDACVSPPIQDSPNSSPTKLGVKSKISLSLSVKNGGALSNCLNECVSDKLTCSVDQAYNLNLSLPKTTVLSKQKAKQRLQAFLPPKQALSLSPLKKCEDGSKNEIKVSPPKKISKKIPVQKAKTVIEEIEEMKKIKTANIMTIGSNFYGRRLGRSRSKSRSRIWRPRDRSYRKNKSWSRSPARKNPTKPPEHAHYPCSWPELKERGLSLDDVKEMKPTKQRKSEESYDFRKQLLFELPSHPVSPLKIKAVGGVEKVVPIQYIRYTKKSPSISYSTNVKHKLCYISQKDAMSYIPRPHKEVIKKLLNNMMSMKFPESPVKSPRKWFPKMMLSNIVDNTECELLEHSIGLSILQNYTDEEDEEEKDIKNETDAKDLRTCDESKLWNKNEEPARDKEDFTLGDVSLHSIGIDDFLKSKSEDCIIEEGDKMEIDNCTKIVQNNAKLDKKLKKQKREKRGQERKESNRKQQYSEGSGGENDSKKVRKGKVNEEKLGKKTKKNKNNIDLEKNDELSKPSEIDGDGHKMNKDDISHEKYIIEQKICVEELTPPCEKLFVKEKEVVNEGNMVKEKDVRKEKGVMKENDSLNVKECVNETAISKEKDIVINPKDTVKQKDLIKHKDVVKDKDIVKDKGTVKQKDTRETDILVDLVKEIDTLDGKNEGISRASKTYILEDTGYKRLEVGNKMCQFRSDSRESESDLKFNENKLRNKRSRSRSRSDSKTRKLDIKLRDTNSHKPKSNERTTQKNECNFKLSRNRSRSKSVENKQNTRFTSKSNDSSHDVETRNFAEKIRSRSGSNENKWKNLDSRVRSTETRQSNEKPHGLEARLKLAKRRRSTSKTKENKNNSEVSKSAEKRLPESGEKKRNLEIKRSRSKSRETNWRNVEKSEPTRTRSKSREAKRLRTNAKSKSRSNSPGSYRKRGLRSKFKEQNIRKIQVTTSQKSRSTSKERYKVDTTKSKPRSQSSERKSEKRESKSQDDVKLVKKPEALLDLKNELDLGTPDTDEYHSHWESADEVVTSSPMVRKKIEMKQNTSWESDEELKDLALKHRSRNRSMTSSTFHIEEKLLERSTKKQDHEKLAERSLEMPLNITHMNRSSKRLRSDHFSSVPPTNPNRPLFSEDSWERGEYLKIRNDIEHIKLRHERQTLSEEKRLLEKERRKLAEKLENYEGYKDSFINKSSPIYDGNQRRLGTRDSRNKSRSVEKYEDCEGDKEDGKHIKKYHDFKKSMEFLVEPIDNSQRDCKNLEHNDLVVNLKENHLKNAIKTTKDKDIVEPAEMMGKRKKCRWGVVNVEANIFDIGNTMNLLKNDNDETFKESFLDEALNKSTLVVKKTDILENEYEEFLKAVTSDISTSESFKEEKKHANDDKRKIKLSKSSYCHSKALKREQKIKKKRKKLKQKEKTRKRRKYRSSSSSSSSESDSSSSSFSSSDYSSNEDTKKKNKKLMQQPKLIRDKLEDKEVIPKLEMTHNIIKDLDDLKPFPVIESPIRVKQEVVEIDPLPDNVAGILKGTIPLPVPSPAIVPPPAISQVNLDVVKREPTDEDSPMPPVDLTTPVKKPALIPSKFMRKPVIADSVHESPKLVHEIPTPFETPQFELVTDMKNNIDDCLNKDVVSYSFSLSSKKVNISRSFNDPDADFTDWFVKKPSEEELKQNKILSSDCKNEEDGEENISLQAEKCQGSNPTIKTVLHDRSTSSEKQLPVLQSRLESVSPKNKESPKSRSMNQMTRNTDLTPKKRDSSPTRRDSSPKKREIYEFSPKRKESPPRRKPESSKKSESSPLRRDLSPRRRDLSPRRKNLFGKQDDYYDRDKMLRKRDVSPGKKNISPIREKNFSHRYRDLSPRRRSSPNYRDSPPRYRDRSPRDMSPGRRRYSPRRRDSSPRSRDYSFRNRTRRSISPHRRSYTRSPSMDHKREPIQVTLQRLAGLDDYHCTSKSPINSPLDGFKRSLADSTISDDQLLLHNSEEYVDSPSYNVLYCNNPLLANTMINSPCSPKRIPLEERINQVLGLDKQGPSPITTTYSQNYNCIEPYIRECAQFTNYVSKDGYLTFNQKQELSHPMSKVVQMGNVLEVVPTEQVQAILSEIKKEPATQPIKQKILQVGNMLQIVPSPQVTPPPSTTITVPTMLPQMLPKVSQIPVITTTSTPTIIALPNMSAPPHLISTTCLQTSLTPSPVTPSPKEKPSPISPISHELTKQKVAEGRAERERRHQERENKRKDKERRRNDREKCKQIKLKQKTEDMIKKALLRETEALAMGENSENQDNLDTSTSSIWPSMPVVSNPLLKPAGKGILISHGFSKLNIIDENSDTKKSVKFADGVAPGEGTSPSGGEELSSPPPFKAAMPKEKRFKKIQKGKKVPTTKKKKIKVKIIRKSIDSNDDDDLDFLPPPSPPPGSPPPHIFPARIKTHAINNVHPSFAATLPTVTVSTYHQFISNMPPPPPHGPHGPAHGPQHGPPLHLTHHGLHGLPHGGPHLPPGVPRP